MSYLGLPLYLFQIGGQGNSNNSRGQGNSNNSRGQGNSNNSGGQGNSNNSGAKKAKKNTKISELLTPNQNRVVGFPEESRLLREEIRRLYREKYGRNIVSSCSSQEDQDSDIVCRLFNHLNSRNLVVDFIQNDPELGPDATMDDVLAIFKPIKSSTPSEPISFYLEPSVEYYVDPNTTNINNLVVDSINAEQGTAIEFDVEDFPEEAEAEEEAEMLNNLVGSDQCLFSNNYRVTQPCDNNGYCVGSGPFVYQSVESPELLAGSIDNCIVPEIRNDCSKCSWNFYKDQIDDLNLPHLNMDQFSLSENSYWLMSEIKNNLKSEVDDNEESGKKYKAIIDRHITSNGGIAPFVAEILDIFSGTKLSDAVTAINSLLIEGTTLAGENLKKKLIEAYKADASQASSDEIYMPTGTTVISQFCDAASNATNATITFSFGFLICCLIICMFFAGLGFMGYITGKKKRNAAAAAKSYPGVVTSGTGGTGGLAKTTAASAGV